MEFQVKLLSDNATKPTKGSSLAAGFDLYSSTSIVIPAKDRGVVDTDISIAVPEGTYGRVAPRSGLGKDFFSLHFFLVSKTKFRNSS